MVDFLNFLRQDVLAFGKRLARYESPSPGFYTYRFTPPGGQVRLHLRIQDDRSGVLFVDVTEVIHLNATAAEMAKWALDGVPREVAEARLRSRTRRGELPRARTDLASIYSMIHRFTQPTGECPTCALDTINRCDLFSTPINAPYKADLAITYKCNNDCPHCYNEADRLTLEAMRAADWRRVIDRLTHVGVPHLIFTGGEATLYSDLPELIAYADACGPICGLNSNGRRFADIGYARELAAAGLNHLQVTLGSHIPAVHDRMMNAHAFHQTVRGIRNAIDAGVHTITNTTLMRMNADDIEDTIQYLCDLGVRTFAVNGMIYSGGGFATGQAIPEEQMPAILIRIRDKARHLGMRFLWYTPTQYCRLSPVELEIGAKRCNAGEYSLCVEPNGDVLPCQSYYAAAGNLLRDPWKQIWNSDLFVSFRDRELNPQGYGLPEKCWECPDLPLCGGGCRIEREAAAGVRTAESGCGSGPFGGCSNGGCGSDGQAVGFVGLDDVAIHESSTSGNQRRGTGEFANQS
jgi:radical SAM protein with 4Fe4S-binding SPASM domain